MVGQVKWGIEFIAYSIINFCDLYNIYDDDEKFKIVGENTENTELSNYDKCSAKKSKGYGGKNDLYG